MADDLEMDPETRRIVEEHGRELMAKRAGKRTVSQLIVEDTTPRPYTVRLTPMEIHRLRGMAHMTDVEASVLARQFIQDGLARLEAEVWAKPDDARQVGRRQAIKLALLSIYDQVDGLATGPAATNAVDEPTG